MIHRRIAVAMLLSVFLTVLLGCDGGREHASLGRNGQHVMPGTESVKECVTKFEEPPAQVLAEWLEEYGTWQWRRDVGGGHIWTDAKDRKVAQAHAEAELKSMLRRIDGMVYHKKWLFIERVALCKYTEGAVDNQQRASWEILVRINLQGYNEAIECLKHSDHPEKEMLISFAEGFKTRFHAE